MFCNECAPLILYQCLDLTFALGSDSTSLDKYIHTVAAVALCHALWFYSRVVILIGLNNDVMRLGLSKAFTSCSNRTLILYYLKCITERRLICFCGKTAEHPNMHLVY